MSPTRMSLNDSMFSGERNGTYAFAKGLAYPSSDHYGRIYTMRSGQPEHIVVTFYNIAPGVERLDPTASSAVVNLIWVVIFTLSLYWF